MRKLAFCIIVCCYIFIFYVSRASALIEQKAIALTFDDEIRPSLFFGDVGISETMKKNGACATFFVLGYQVKSSPDIFKKLAVDGHEIENHTWGHENLLKLVGRSGIETALENINKTSSEIESVTGRRPKFFRPPYWALGKDLKTAIETNGYRIMTIGSPDINTLDYEDAAQKRPASVLVSRVIKIIEEREASGAYRHVLVFHQTKQTRDALQTILPELRKQGYVFVTLDQFFTPKDASESEENTALGISKTSNDSETPVRALYLSIDNLSSKKKVAVIENILNTTNANSVVIDFKVDAIAPEKIIRSLILRFKKHGAYLIARITVMQDSSLARRNPSVALRRTDGTLWWSGRKEWRRYWVDPSSPDVLAYAIDVAKQAMDMGFDEINFDYIRFPTDGDLSAIIYPLYNARTATKSEVMNNFFSELTGELRKYNSRIKLSVDLFGEVAAYGQEKGIGQELLGTAKYFDVLAPMAYPSHYRCGTFGLKDPNAHPYLVYQKTLSPAKQFLEKEHMRAIIRPWIQAFSLKSIYRCGPFIFYGAREIRAQIEAGAGIGVPSFMLWNAVSSYFPNYFLTKE